MKYFSVDRIVEDVAVIEQPDKSFIDVLLKDLPKGIKEGDVLIKTEDGFLIDIDETSKRKKSMFNLQNSLFENKD